MGRRNSDAGRFAAIWFATTIVLVLGAAATAFVVLIGAEDPELPMMIWAGIFTAIILGIIIYHINWEEPVNQMKFWLSYHQKSDPNDEYVAAKRRIKNREQYGNNSPPTLESVRDAADHGGAWVPRSKPETRGPKKS